MRKGLFSSVAILAIMAGLPAYAGFEFVSPPSPATVPVITNTPAETPVIDNAPVATAPLDNTSAVPPVLSGEPMPIGTRAIPLTPIASDSDALVIDDVPTLAAPQPVMMPPVPAPTPVPRTASPLPQPSGNSILWDNNTPMAQTNKGDMLPAARPLSDISDEPMAPPMIQTDIPPVAAAQINEDDLSPPIQGFGRQVPLVMALQQIVPASFRYSFDHGVDPGMRINWTGGKSWKAVITDIAQTNKLNVDIVSNVVAFRRMSPMDIALTPSIPTAEPVIAMPTPVAMAPAATAPMNIMDNAAATPRQMLAEARAQNTEDTGIADPIARTPVVTWNETPPPAEKTVAAPMRIVPKEVPQKATMTQAEKPQPPSASEKEKTFFDTLFDGEQKPAAGAVKDKKILTENDRDEDAVANAASLPDVKPAAAQPVMDLPPITDDVAMAPPMPLLPVAETASAPLSAPVASKANLTQPAEWQAAKDATLRQTLKQWAEQAGVSLVWSSEYDYPLQTDVRIQGSFGEAVRTLLAGFSKAEPRPLGRLFKNQGSGAQPVLVVETQRLTN